MVLSLIQGRRTTTIAKLDEEESAGRGNFDMIDYSYRAYGNGASDMVCTVSRQLCNFKVRLPRWMMLVGKLPGWQSSR